MNRRSALWCLMLAVSMLLTGCAKPWTVVLAAAPNPFANQRRFAIAPMSFERLVVGEKDEQSYLAEKDGEQRASWDGDKAGLNENFAAGLIEVAREAGIEVVLATGPQAAPFFLRANVGYIEPGIFTGFFNKPTEVKITLFLTDASGAILDEVQLASTIPPGLTNPASGGRIRSAGKDLGARAGRYLRFRVTGED